MQTPSLPFTKDLVLIGGGHSHALVLQAWAMNPLPGARVTLINPGPTATYSGMLPGFVAGHYQRDQLDIDLIRLARRAGARLVMAAATGIDTQARRIQVKGGPDIGFDVASIDIGTTSGMPDLPGFAKHGVPAKPLGRFATRWARYADSTGPARVAVIGGGVAGAELALAMAHRLRNAGRDAQVSVIEQNRAFTALGPKAASQMRAALKQHGIMLLEGAAPERISKTGVHLNDGRRVEADFITGAAGAKPHEWLAGTGLTDSQGFIPIDLRLRSSNPTIFAVGDCAEMTASPRPKAGVYAVRQAPILLNNLRATLSGSGGLKPYVPQNDYLKLVSLGEKAALGERLGITFSGRWVWRWKDQIDTAFMDKFSLPKPIKPALPWPRASGTVPAGDQALCGGCGAKLGLPTLRRALHGNDDTPVGDDAAILRVGQTRQVISHDHLRAMVDDPVTLTRIAAVHALGDIWAMGATPQAAVSSIILPHQSPVLAERHLREITQTAHDVMTQAGAKIVGGHSTQGAEMTIGFTVTGLCHGEPITLEGARPGDHLILTKPLGSGVIMAGDMEGKARGTDVAEALRVMTRPQTRAARHLANAHAMTDVTGFGLVGHLSNMLHASGVGAEIVQDAIPLMTGALRLSEKGIRSTLYPQNREGFEHFPETAHSSLLFDPQTGGGLLAAIGGDPAPVIEALRQDEETAALIGRITEDRGQFRIV